MLKLLEKGPLLKEERDRARKLSRGIQGFGSFIQRPSSSSSQGILREKTPLEKPTYGRSNSEFSSHENEENQFPCPKQESLSASKPGKVTETSENSNLTKPEASLKENMAPEEGELHGWNRTGESNPLLDGKIGGELRVGSPTMEDDHPFLDAVHRSSTATASLLC